MAVVYMRKLEEQPDTYDNEFTTLTKGVNLKVHEWVINHLNTSESILEVGCGTGNLATKMALKGNDVVAIDKNFFMINHAMQNYPSDANINLSYQIGTLSDTQIEPRSKDVIVSTFMLSELRPLEQQILLRNAWKALKPNGRLILAAEFMPSGFWKIPFKIKRWRYKKKLKRLRLKQTFLLNWFYKYIEPIGYEISAIKKWKHGSIQALELKKVDDNHNNEPGYYRPKDKTFTGIKSQFRIYRCILTGQVDRVPIEPGIYKSGNPNLNSPIIVTANYEYTFIKVMRDLKNIDAWVLCVDSNGINVWCAARGDEFGNKQLIEAVEGTGIQKMVETKALILPQLSAGGIAVPELPKKSENFPFIIKYGPVWSKQLPEYLRDKPVRKPESMKLAKFSLSHRIQGFITHSTFLLRKVFLKPIIGLMILLITLSIIFTPNWMIKFWWIGELCLWIIVSNLIISLLFPLSNFTRTFIYKGILFGGMSIVVLGTLTMLFHNSLLILLLNSSFHFWIAFFSTMSFSGYTMATNPSEIQGEYPTFRKINLIILIISLVLLAFGMIIY